MSDLKDENIEIRGARVNNLKNLSIKIPRDRFIVVTGLSGSGKSSLAFDTLYAEGQRRYVESLSVYARQFVGKMAKPECDYITGIPPAIAIKQRTSLRTPRSTVGTSTEVYDYMRMLFARVGKTISPKSGIEVRRHTVADVREFVLSLPQGTKILVTAPLVVPPQRSLWEHLQLLKAIGYARICRDEKILRLSDLSEEEVQELKSEELNIVVDRLVVGESDTPFDSRLGDAVETAFYEGRGQAFILYERAKGEESEEKEWVREPFSDRFEADGILFEEPSDNLFSFNSPVGACPLCEGFSKVMGIDEDLVVPNKRLSLYDGAVVCWRGEKMSEWLKAFIRDSEVYDFPIHRPYNELSEQEKELLWKGKKGVHGILDFFAHLEEHTYKMHYRIMLARYRGKTTCPECKGQRLRKEALYVKVGGKNIAELAAMPISQLYQFLSNLTLSGNDAKIGGKILQELHRRVSFLYDIGLGYLSCDRLSNTLSGGESQRIALSTALGSGLIGSMYILDEPSIGLHSRDTHLLIDILQRLTQMGNSVLVVEHDEEIIRSADQIIDIGPGAGIHGGEVVYQGIIKEKKSQKKGSKTNSLTLKYMRGEESIPWPQSRRGWDRAIHIQGAYLHNLKDIPLVRFPLHTINVVTGVSGSGKSTLVREILYEGMKRLLDNAPIEAIPCSDISGHTSDIKGIEYVDQNTLGRSSRSNPVTYIGAYDEIRKLYASQPLAKRMGYTPAYFSFNKAGGRCENCKGEGEITVEMQFMADIKVVCEECQGRRFTEDLLEVTFEGKSIADLLDLSIGEAIEFFGTYEEKVPECRPIVEKLRALEAVGLSYIKLGQSSSTLSGGESQRVKLAYYLVGNKTEHTLFIFDEPTTGLHIHDIRILLEALQALVDRGHSVLIIEHNMEVIKSADYIIDLGPEGGEQGGYLLYEGTPEGLMECKDSYTGKFLKDKYLSDKALEGDAKPKKKSKRG